MEKAKLDSMDEKASEEGLEVHPLIELLIARMESNPQEFYRFDPTRSFGSTMPNNTKMTTPVSLTIEHTKSLWNRKEKRLYNMALRKVRMQEAHERLMAAILA